MDDRDEGLYRLPWNWKRTILLALALFVVLSLGLSMLGDELFVAPWTIGALMITGGIALVVQWFSARPN